MSVVPEVRMRPRPNPTQPSPPRKAAGGVRPGAATPEAESQARQTAMSARHAPPDRYPTPSPITSATRDTHAREPIMPPPPEA